MKWLLTFLVSFPIFANAQSFEIGLGGGVSSNTAPIGVSLPAGNTEKGWQLSYSGSFSFFFNLTNWQLGLCAEAYELKTKYDIATTGAAGELHSKGTTVYASPEVPLLLQVNRMVYFRKSYLYFGLSGWSGLNFRKDASGATYYNEMQPVVGAQVGYTYGLSDVFGLNVNLAARYNIVPGNPMLSFPLSVGTRFRL